ncbi:MAG: FkbM family methyltransferase [Rhodothermales bacterium]|nr:FkbM family methyltransferase [Rhodothermales bacterium]
MSSVVDRIRNIAKDGMLLDRMFWKASVTWKPFSVTSFKIVSALTKHEAEFTTIIDGGANIGQFARAVVELYPTARVFCFEPLEDIATELKLNLRDCQRVTVVQAALASTNKSLPFFRNLYHQASSALEIKPEASQLHEKVSESTTKIHVNAVSLDEYFSNNEIVGPTLLKLDLQGYELQALHGATRILPQVDFVLVEVAVQQSYEGEPEKGMIESFMLDQGFEQIDILNSLVDGDGNITQVDVLFKKCGHHDA